jgi:hypothetical protein
MAEFKGCIKKYLHFKKTSFKEHKWEELDNVRNNCTSDISGEMSVFAIVNGTITLDEIGNQI